MKERNKRKTEYLILFKLVARRKETRTNDYIIVLRYNLRVSYFILIKFTPLPVNCIHRTVIFVTIKQMALILRHELRSISPRRAVFL